MTLTLSLQLIAALQLTRDTISFILFQDVLGQEVFLTEASSQVSSNRNAKNIFKKQKV